MTFLLPLPCDRPWQQTHHNDRRRRAAVPSRPWSCRVGDKTVFTIKGNPATASDQLRAHAVLVHLDRSASVAQVVMTSFTGGAHWCTETQIASSDSDGRWSVLKADRLDGDGYQFEDSDGDGVSELVSVDNSFLYAFDAYAMCMRPPAYTSLQGPDCVKCIVIMQGSCGRMYVEWNTQPNVRGNCGTPMGSLVAGLRQRLWSVSLMTPGLVCSYPMTVIATGHLRNARRGRLWTNARSALRSGLHSPRHCESI